MGNIKEQMQITLYHNMPKIQQFVIKALGGIFAGKSVLRGTRVGYNFVLRVILMLAKTIQPKQQDSHARHFRLKQRNLQVF
jgi:hypothetical protein